MAPMCIMCWNMNIHFTSTARNAQSTMQTGAKTNHSRGFVIRDSDGMTRITNLNHAICNNYKPFNQ